MYKKLFSLIFMVIFITISNCPLVFAKELILENGTKIRLKLANPVSTKFNNEGDDVDFIVADDVKFDDIILIKEGSRATGIISELIPTGKIGKAGRLLITLDSVRAVNGKKIPISATVSKKGEDNMILSAALSILVMPLCLLMKGTDANLPINYQVMARVDRDITLILDDNIYPVADK